MGGGKGGGGGGEGGKRRRHFAVPQGKGGGEGPRLSFSKRGEGGENLFACLTGGEGREEKWHFREALEIEEKGVRLNLGLAIRAEKGQHRKIKRGESRYPIPFPAFKGGGPSKGGRRFVGGLASKDRAF